MEKAIKELVSRALAPYLAGFREIREDLAWAAKVLRRARRHFGKGYLCLIVGTILLGIERVVPWDPARKAAALLGIAFLAASGVIYWHVIRG